MAYRMEQVRDDVESPEHIIGPETLVIEISRGDRRFRGEVSSEIVDRFFIDESGRVFRTLLKQLLLPYVEGSNAKT